MTAQRTPLYEDHLKLKARMVEFAGWEMPIQYLGLKEEHLNVRQNVGLFDVSHMGEIRVQGPQALATLQWLTSNDVAKLKKGEAQYSLLPNDKGGMVDDIIVYCLEPDQDYLVCVNAANKDKDFAWMTKNNKGAKMTDESLLWGQIAVQGPKAQALIKDVCNIDLSATPAFRILPGEYQGFKFLLATTGYTGEKGCEIFIETKGTSALWNALLKQGEKYSVQAIGLGARDTLRTEMAYSLYGHEIDDQTNPYGANLGWVVKPSAKDFMGKSLILSQREAGLKQKLVGLKMVDRGIPREGYKLYSADKQEIGKITSGTHSPSLDEPIGISYVASDFAVEGTEVFVDIRGRHVKAKVCKMPFLTKTN